MSATNDFELAFESLTGNGPFPWQADLYEKWFSQGRVPSVCDIPTGLGKTSVIAIWLIARANGSKLPRRLVYVVNRRTVVDQTTNEVEKLRSRLMKPEEQEITPAQIAYLQSLATRLAERPGKQSDVPLAISTLRGQFADNREWSVDPARPAVICGTVDMIGSRLLFSGYRIGFKSRPLHAGFLGQDALLIHDEAHLEPAFQALIETIETEQTEHENTGKLPWPKLRVMALSATARNGDGANREIFGLGAKDQQHQVVRRRIEAKKSLSLHSCDDEKKGLPKQILGHALQHQSSGEAVIVFVRGVEDAIEISGALEKVLPEQVCSLTGTMRGFERDRLVRSNGVFARFMPSSDRSQDAELAEGTVYLVSTSAGEVGINISADHMVCDLSSFDSMAQRLGRVNRFGAHSDSRIDVIHPTEFADTKPDPQRRATLDLLIQLRGDASPRAVAQLPAEQKHAAFAPTPGILPATDILFDAWALTTIRKRMPGRPPVEPYLHGVAEWEPPRTSVAWREEVSRITDELIERHSKDFLQDLLNDYPLKPHEMLSDTTERVYKQLQQLTADPRASVRGENRQQALERVRKNAAAKMWLIDDRGVISVQIGKLLSGERKGVIERLANCTVLLPPSVGGLAGGMLNGASERASDVADIPDGPDRRMRVYLDDSDNEAARAKVANLRRVRSIELPARNREDDNPYLWEWYESLPLEGGRIAKKPVMWQTHVGDVVNNAKQIVRALLLPQKIADAVVLAAELHDHGKRRERFQTTLGNRRYPEILLAKSGERGARLPEPFRHEFASLFDAQAGDAVNDLGDEMKDLVLHLIAAHHGRARPNFSREEAFDPERSSSEAESLAIETSRRFARLQRQYGRWGLAYLESLLRAADWKASANPSAYADDPTDKK